MKQKIDGALFRRMVISASAAVDLNKQKINELNVFPVPDGDTGTNMGMTLGSAAADLKKNESPTLTKAADIAASAMLRGARGNSGVILSLLFRGFSTAWLTDKEKRIVAYHEIGHALVAAKQTNSAPVQKITIVPRTSGALGYTMQVEEGNHYLMTKEEILNKIATLTGGRAAEEIVFGSVTTGASNDIEQATKLARAMITRYGMTCDFDMVAMEVQTNQYLGGDSSLTCSTETQTKIDEKVVEVVRSEHEKAAGILMENREKLDDLARYLYEKETITGEEFMNILNA